MTCKKKKHIQKRKTYITDLFLHVLIMLTSNSIWYFLSQTLSFLAFLSSLSSRSIPAMVSRLFSRRVFLIFMCFVKASSTIVISPDRRLCSVSTDSNKVGVIRFSTRSICTMTDATTSCTTPVGGSADGSEDAVVVVPENERKEKKSVNTLDQNNQSSQSNQSN